MASSLFSSITTHALMLFLLHSSSLYTNIAAKHGHSSYHRHRTRSHSPTSNPRLHQAYVALQAWKRVIYSDPYNFTTNWMGPNVCNYKGVYCTAALDDPKIKVVAAIDLNFADIAGFLPDELGLLTDLSLIHLNSNRFCGILPQTLSNLSLLYELDLSNNRFVGPFPSVALSLPMLNFLDLRFNEFEGAIPSQLFLKKLDVIFVNNNRFTTMIPSIPVGASASVLVIANNNFRGCLPPSIANLADSLEELLIINTNLTGCLPPEVGYLYRLKVLDLSYNKLIGPLPYSLAGLAHLEQLHLDHNVLTGLVPQGICVLPNLVTFNFSNNFFCEEEGICMNLTSKGIRFDDRRNCLPDKPLQRSKEECNAVLEHPVDCFLPHCQAAVSGGSFGGTVAFAPALSPAESSLLSPSFAPSNM